MDSGFTALMMAGFGVDIDLVKLLLERGADVTQVHSVGKSVLDMLDEEDHAYSEVRELCTQYIDCNMSGAKQLLK